MTKFIEENHRIIQKTLLDDTDLVVGKPIIIGKIKRGGFLDEAKILFSSADIASGVASLALHSGSESDKIMIPAFLKAPVVATKIATPTSILTVDTSVADATTDNTNTLVHTLGEVVDWIFTNKASATNMKTTDLNEGFFFLVMTLTAGTVTAGTKMGTEIVIGQ